MTKKIIVSGATGQDGSYMIEYLLKNTDNTIIAAIRRTSQAILSNLKEVLDNPRVKLVTMDLCDGEAIRRLIREEKPDYFINFGAQTFVKDSWEHPVAHMQTNAISLIHILESIREYVPHCRTYSSGSSEQWGDVEYSPQDEKHPNRPRSIYGVSKVAAQGICKVYRESYGLYVVHGILLNHESERRQDYFLTRKVTKGVARIAKAIKEGKSFEPISLGNLDAKRDWSHSEDFVRGIWAMLNQNSPREYVLSSGDTHSVREFVEKAFLCSGLGNDKLEWVRDGLSPEDEKYVRRAWTYDEKTGGVKNWHILDTLVTVNPAFYRPADVHLLHGDSSAARRDLGWSPQVTFDQLVQRMVKADLADVGL